MGWRLLAGLRGKMGEPDLRACDWPFVSGGKRAQSGRRSSTPLLPRNRPAATRPGPAPQPRRHRRTVPTGWLAFNSNAVTNFSLRTSDNERVIAALDPLAMKLGVCCQF